MALELDLLLLCRFQKKVSQLYDLVKKTGMIGMPTKIVTFEKKIIMKWQLHKNHNVLVNYAYPHWTKAILYNSPIISKVQVLFGGIGSNTHTWRICRWKRWPSAGFVSPCTGRCFRSASAGGCSGRPTWKRRRTDRWWTNHPETKNTSRPEIKK